jgi:hypothetical protein
VDNDMGIYCAATGFRKLLLRDLDFKGARSESGTLCQPVTSGICGDPDCDPSPYGWKYAPGAVAAFRGVGGEPAVALPGRDRGELLREAMSDKGALGRRIPPSSGGDCEWGSLGIGNEEMAGELKDEEGTEPEDARETVRIDQSQ